MVAWQPQFLPVRPSLLKLNMRFCETAYFYGQDASSMMLWDSVFSGALIPLKDFIQSHAEVDTIEGR